jgi:hypothetical protein
MRRAIVHIGMPRSGTTSLQALLSAYRRELSEAGVLYPDLKPRSETHSHLSHQYLGEALDGRRPRRELRELLAQLDAQLAATHGDTTLLSYEGFSQLSSWHSGPWTLRELFARHGFEMQILVTLKAQDLYAQSCYTWRCQFLREARYFAEWLPGSLRQRRFNYLVCVRPWAIAAAGRVLAIPVHAQGNSVPLIERVLEALGLAERIGPSLKPRELLRMDNRSLGPAAIEVARRICERSGAQRENGHACAIIACVETAARLRGFPAVAFQALDHAMSERVMERFVAGNDRFARSVWGENWSRRVARPQLAPVNAFGPDSPPDYLDAQLDSIVMQVRRQFGLEARHGLLSRARALLEPPRSVY